MPDRMLAEFATVDDIAAAIHSLRERGYQQLEAYTPYPSEEVFHALGLPRSRLGYTICAIGMLAAGGAYFLQWLLNAYLYPLDAGGRPPHFPLAFVPITFEMGVLFASFTAFFGVLVVGRLLRLNDEVQATPGFETATRDHFWLEVSMHDPHFDLDRTRDDLADLGALRVEIPPEVPS